MSVIVNGSTQVIKVAENLNQIVVNTQTANVVEITASQFQVSASQPTQVLEVNDSTYEIVVDSQPVQVITASQGARGPQGIPGQGVPVGGSTGQILTKVSDTDYDTDWADSTGDKTYVHNQISPSTLWTVNHNLGKFPSASIVDSGGTEVLGTIEYIDDDSLTITFTVSFGGRVFCN